MSEGYTGKVDLYRVGALADLQRIGRCLRHVRTLGWKVWRANFRSVRGSFRRGWRRKNYWNGYLAEPTWGVDGPVHYRCGAGWTRKRAMRSLIEHVREYEGYRWNL